MKRRKRYFESEDERPNRKKQAVRNNDEDKGWLDEVEVEEEFEDEFDEETADEEDYDEFQ
ncbi:MAG: hypothetical protein V2A71_05050 [Candidatus Eisenbacteria bacterium]